MTLRAYTETGLDEMRRAVATMEKVVFPSFPKLQPQLQEGKPN
jgi:hypothetical protein